MFSKAGIKNNAYILQQGMNNKPVVPILCDSLFFKERTGG
jgi:hypothetical protein